MGDARAGCSYRPRMPLPSMTVRAGLSHREAAYGRGLILKHLEDGVPFGELQKIMHALGEVQQFHLASGSGDSRVRGYQFTEARAVHVGNVGQVQNDPPG